MTRRRLSDSVDSLELLLDTICNTFGAVIFISLLVALLVRQRVAESEPQPDRLSAAETVARIQTQIQTDHEQLRVLNAQWRQQDRVTKQFATEESIRMAKDLHQQTEARMQLLESRSDATETLSRTQANVAKLQQTIEDRQRNLETVESEHRRLQSELLQLKELSGRIADTSQVRKTTKNSAVFALDDGRLFRVTTPEQTIDSVDCERVDAGPVRGIRLRPDAGALISDGAETAGVRQRLEGVHPRTHFVQLFVARDAFAAFLPLKDKLVERGLEYEVRIMDGDEVELAIGRSDVESFVQ